MTYFLLMGSAFAILGTLTGLLAGILGIGGGLIVVPGLLFIFEYAQLVPQNIVMHMAAGSSLAAMIVTSAVSLRAHQQKSPVLWPIYNKLWPGITLGTISGTIAAQWMTTFYLKIIFALFLISVALKMLLDVTVIQPVRTPAPWINRLASFLIGLKSGLLGVGGGILIIPYLTYCGIEVRKITAISSACTLTVACVGTLACIITGYHETLMIAYAWGYVFVPAALVLAFFSSLTAPIGVKLSYVLPVPQLKLAFIIMLIMTAIKLLF